MRGVILLAICVAVSGCTVRLHGHQATSGGVTTSTTSSAVSGSATAGNAKVALNAGQPVSPRAPGGHLKVSGEAAAALLIGIVVVDAVHRLTTYFTSPPAAADRSRDSIAGTCSCYGYRGGPAPAQQ